MNEVFFGNLWHFSKKSENHNIGMVWSENWKKSTLMWWWQYVIVKMIVTNF